MRKKSSSNKTLKKKSKVNKSRSSSRKTVKKTPLRKSAKSEKSNEKSLKSLKSLKNKLKSLEKIEKSNKEDKDGLSATGSTLSQDKQYDNLQRTLSSNRDQMPTVLDSDQDVPFKLSEHISEVFKQQSYIQDMMIPIPLPPSPSFDDDDDGIGQTTFNFSDCRKGLFLFVLLQNS